MLQIPAASPPSLGQAASLAQLGHVSRARISQILKLVLLAPDIQEAILFLPPTLRGRDPIHLRQLQPLAALWDWEEQRSIDLRWPRFLAVPQTAVDGAFPLVAFGHRGQHRAPGRPSTAVLLAAGNPTGTGAAADWHPVDPRS
jgi:hypothetical protein